MSKTAIVTGAGSGIGRAVAQALAAKGYSLTLAGRRRSALDETAAGLEGGAAGHLVVPTDVADEAAVDALFDACVARYGRLHLLFNNAGSGTPPTPIDELPVQAWTDVIGANLTGTFLCMRAAFRVMKAQSPQGGRIINNGSISAYAPRPWSWAYTASKHGVTGLTRSGSLDGRAYDIACGQIDIGNAATELTARMASGVPQADGSVRIEPLMDVAAVGEAVVYMASLPPSANVQFMTVMATKMPFVGRG